MADSAHNPTRQQPDWDPLVIKRLLPLLGHYPDITPAVLRAADWPDADFFTTWARDHDLFDCRDRRISFAVQPSRPSRWRRRLAPRIRYEEQILNAAQIFGRPRNWHDLLNNMTWCVFPRLKSTLVEMFLGRQQPGALAGANGRTKVMDRLAMFEEGGTLEALCGQTGQSLGKTPYGHGLFESMMLGHQEIRSLTLPVAVPAQFVQWDARERLQQLDISAAAAIRSGVFDDRERRFAGTMIEELMLT